MIKYKGRRSKKDSFDITVLVEISDKNKIIKTEPLNHIVRHSPTGFEWGYMGSGPSDLSLSILVDYLSRTRDLSCEDSKKIVKNLYILFKEEKVSKFPEFSWEINDNEIENFLSENY